MIMISESFCNYLNLYNTCMLYGYIACLKLAEQKQITCLNANEQFRSTLENPILKEIIIKHFAYSIFLKQNLLK